MAVSAAVAGAVVAAGAATTAGVQANAQRQDAKGAAFKQEEAQKKAEKQLSDKKHLDSAEAERVALRERTRVLRGGQAGRKGTILTQPLGAPAPAAAVSPAKTMIG